MKTSEPTSEHLQKLAEARRVLLYKCPYYATAVYAFRPVVEIYEPGEQIQYPCALDASWNLFINEEFFEAPPSTRAALLEHEIGHLLRRHPERLRMREPQKWNIAGDLEMHNTGGLEFFNDLPAGVCYPKLFGLPEGKTAEYYYEHLDLDGGGGGKNPDNDNHGHCFRESDKNDPDGDDSSGQKTERVSAGVTIAAAEEVRNGKDIGSFPSWLQIAIEEYLKPVHIPQWKRYLQNTLFARSPERSFHRPARRSFGGFILPGNKAPIAQAAIVLDTSGSVLMGGILDEVFSHTKALLDVCAKPVVIYACDAEVHSKTSVKKLSDLEGKVIGGGGTDMGAGIRRAVKDGAKTVVVLTDGYTPWPEHSPGARVVILRIDPNSPPPPRWAVDVPYDGPTS